MKSVIGSNLTVKISPQNQGYLGSAKIYREGHEELLATIVFNVTNGINSTSVSVHPVAESRFSRAKYPLWNSPEDYRRKILSAVVEVSSAQSASDVLLVFAFSIDDGLVR